MTAAIENSAKTFYSQMASGTKDVGIVRVMECNVNWARTETRVTLTMQGYTRSYKRPKNYNQAMMLLWAFMIQWIGFQFASMPESERAFIKSRRPL